VYMRRSAMPVIEPKNSTRIILNNVLYATDFSADKRNIRPSILHSSA
jgi:hypothetical protein